MADTPQQLRPPEFTGKDDTLRNLWYVIEQIGQFIAIAIMAETAETIAEIDAPYLVQRRQLAEKVIAVPALGKDVLAVAVAKRLHAAAFSWASITDAQIRDHMEDAWTICARGKFPAPIVAEDS